VAGRWLWRGMRVVNSARQCQFAISIIRLTSLKSLCREAEEANCFVTYLAGKPLEHAALAISQLLLDSTRRGGKPVEVVKRGVG
jgi:hypothetical protein